MNFCYEGRQIRENAHIYLQLHFPWYRIIIHKNTEQGSAFVCCHNFNIV